MLEQERIKICKTCQRRCLHKDLGLICGLTDQKPTFENECPDYLVDEIAVERQKGVWETITSEVDSSDGLTGVCVLVAAVIGLMLIDIIEEFLWPLVGGALLLIGVMLFSFWIYRRLYKTNATKLTKSICKYLYSTGHLYKIEDGEIVFYDNDYKYRIGIMPHSKYYWIKLTFGIGDENTFVQKLYCANATNSFFHNITVSVFDKGCVFDTYFAIKYSYTFKQEFPMYLGHLKEAVSHYVQASENKDEEMIDKQKTRPRIGFHKE